MTFLSSTFLLSGCSTFSYLIQAGHGQLELINHARPISEVLSDPNVDPELAQLLKMVEPIKAFGEKSGLKKTPNYDEYVQLEREYPVYVVTACAKTSFEPEIFSFPIVGSFNYLGWFHLDDARKHAESLKAKGLDVDVRGAAAYSTLGWFKDPILWSMFPRKNGKISERAFAALVNVVLHESVHATLYIKNQSIFNESLASFIADRLTEKYLKDLGSFGQEKWVDYQKSNRDYEKLQVDFKSTFDQLKKLYDSNVSETVKLEEKGKLISSLQAKYPNFREINNATLVQFQTYHHEENVFAQYFKKTNEDVQAFLKVLAHLKPEDFERPHQESLGAVLGKWFP